MPPAVRTESELTRPAVEAALERVVDPCSIATGVPISLPEMGLVQRIEIRDGAVTVTLRLTSPICLQSMNIVAAVQERLLEVDGVVEAGCEVDPAGEWLPTMMSERARADLRRRRERSRV
jgi:metal-sulfur cluster biosynthetic enzyme